MIRWEENGYGGYLGYAGTLDTWLFQIERAQWRDREDTWILRGELPGHCARGPLAERPEPDPLKADAAELLGKWAAAVGAVFPGTDSEPQEGRT